ncbi:V-type proton ATPase subunit S1 [Acrasis kona]|uniref:V-type proton ATPase subunit S1 n=1 Tax=Acrasis kona TaxID=1008807 RepID=A0AAW2YMV1_9EUKA
MIKFVVLLALTCAACALNVPAFFWSGKDYLGDKYAHVASEQHLVNIAETQINKKPKVFVAFMHKNLPSDEFLKYSGAYSENSSDNSFANLKKNVQEESKTSMVFPKCRSHPTNTLSESLSEKENVNVVNDVNEFIKTLDTMKASEEEQIFLINFEEANSAQQYAEMDRMMNEITSKLRTISNDDFIAMLSSEVPASSRRTLLRYEDDEEEVLDYDVLFDNNLLNVNQATPSQTPAPTPNTTHPPHVTPKSDYANPSYITGSIFGGVLVGALLIFILFVALAGLVNIGVAPRMTDLDVYGEDQNKKYQ